MNTSPFNTSPYCEHIALLCFPSRNAGALDTHKKSNSVVFLSFIKREHAIFPPKRSPGDSGRRDSDPEPSPKLAQKRIKKTELAPIN